MEKDKITKPISETSDSLEKMVESLNEASDSLGEVSDSLGKMIESLDEASKLLDEVNDSLEELIQTHIDFYKEICHRVLIFFIYLMILAFISLFAMMSIY